MFLCSEKNFFNIKQKTKIFPPWKVFCPPNLKTWSRACSYLKQDHMFCTKHSNA